MENTRISRKGIFLVMVLASAGFTCVILTAGNLASYPFISVQVGLLLLIAVVFIHSGKSAKPWSQEAGS